MTSEKLDLHLRQRHWLFGRRDLILNGNNTLTIKERVFFRQDETTLPLEVLQPNPTHASSFAMRWLLNSLFVGSITALFVFFAFKFSSWVMAGLSGIFGILALVLLYRFFVYTTNLVIYRHIQTNENFLYLWKNNPNPNEFWQFTRELSRRIVDSTNKIPA